MSFRAQLLTEIYLHLLTSCIYIFSLLQFWFNFKIGFQSSEYVLHNNRKSHHRFKFNWQKVGKFMWITETYSYKRINDLMQHQINLHIAMGSLLYFITPWSDALWLQFSAVLPKNKKVLRSEELRVYFIKRSGNLLNKLFNFSAI